MFCGALLPKGETILEGLLKRKLWLPDELPPPDAQVTVACYPFSLYKGTLGTKTEAIIARAVEICNTYRVTDLVLMGGWLSEGKTEGGLMQEYVQAHPVPERTVIHVEHQTRDTFKQADHLQRLYAQNVLKPNSGIAVVADVWHLQRCEFLTSRRLPHLQVYRANAHGAWGPNDKLMLTKWWLFGPRELATLRATQYITRL